MPLRILHCIPSLLGGGAEKQLCYLAAGLVRRGHEVHVAHQYDGPNVPLLRESGATIHHIPPLRPYDPRAMTAIATILRRERIQILQTWLRRMDVWGSLAARLEGVPWIFSERNALTVDERTASAHVLRALMPLAWGVVANSETGADIWRHDERRRLPVRVVPNAIPVDRIAGAAVADRRELGLPEGVPLVLYAGRFTPVKNAALLTDVMVEIVRARPDVHALFLGEGPELDGLRARVRAQGLSRRIVLPGYREDLSRWMKTATVFVSPSRVEGRPNVVMEAMACGCPLVLSDIPQHREFVAPDEAVWCRTDDAASLREGVTRALDDPSGARRRAEEALTSIGRFSIDAMVASYEAIYEEILHHA